MTGRVPLRRRGGLSRLLLAAAGLSTMAGCYTQEQYDQALQRSADLQLQLDQAKSSLAAKIDELKAQQAAAAELAIAKEKALRAITQSAHENEQLRKDLDAARREYGSATSSLDREHAALQRALDSQKAARSQMEQELSDRQRQIDILASKVRRLERELEEIRKSPAPRPSTQATR